MQQELPQHELREETPTTCVLTGGLIVKGNRDFLAVGKKNEDSQKEEEKECTWTCNAGSGLKFLAGPRLQRACRAGQRSPGDSDPEFAEDPAVADVLQKRVRKRCLQDTPPIQDGFSQYSWIYGLLLQCRGRKQARHEGGGSTLAIQHKAWVTSDFVSTHNPLGTARCDRVTSWSHHPSVYSAESYTG